MMPSADEQQCKPYLEWHFPKELKTKAIQIIYSGGAYMGNDPDGFEVTPARRYLNERGMTVVTMKYRTPRPTAESGLAKHTSAWQDLQRAIRIVRSKAASFGLDPAQIGIMGSSAGGHLAATVATHAPASLRPAFQILLYPVITTDPSFTHYWSCRNLMGEHPSQELLASYSNELQVSPSTPPAFIAASADDGDVPVLNTARYYEALVSHGINANVHIYPTGGHGWGYRASFDFHFEMLHELKAWLSSF
jgi:acetyl esterase/lipase